MYVYRSNTQASFAAYERQGPKYCSCEKPLTGEIKYFVKIQFFSNLN